MGAGLERVGILVILVRISGKEGRMVRSPGAMGRSAVIVVMILAEERERPGQPQIVEGVDRETGHDLELAGGLAMVSRVSRDVTQAIGCAYSLCW